MPMARPLLFLFRSLISSFVGYFSAGDGGKTKRPGRGLKSFSAHYPCGRVGSEVVNCWIKSKVFSDGYTWICMIVNVNMQYVIQSSSSDDRWHRSRTLQHASEVYQLLFGGGEQEVVACRHQTGWGDTSFWLVLPEKFKLGGQLGLTALSLWRRILPEESIPCI